MSRQVFLDASSPLVPSGKGGRRDHRAIEIRPNKALKATRYIARFSAERIMEF
jgi:hypothetical protein